MAELAIPLIGLGALYVMSNQKQNNKNKGREGFISNRKESLPNTNLRNTNFPGTNVQEDNSPIDSTSQNYTREYLNPNQTTDKFFNADCSPPQDRELVIQALNGNQINKSEFKHNNMVPFFGSKLTGPTLDKTHNNAILDNKQGSGSYYHDKVERAPLFNPQTNAQWTHGAPNNSDFIQSRQLPSTKISNVLPWEQEKVGPGLGLGYTTEGRGGFNSGVLDRDEWKPPTVDELRVKSNPKVTFNLNGHEGPAMSKIINPGTTGTIEKNRPNTDFALGPDRWFTTTGNTLGQTLISEQVVPENNRQHTSQPYFGVTGNDGDSKVSYVKGNYKTSSRNELVANALNPVSAGGQGGASEGDYGNKSYKLLPNNRQQNCESKNKGNVGGINGVFGAMVAPIIDILRPTRKQNVIGNPNLVGNLTSLVPQLPLTNPNNIAKTTIKETTNGAVALQHLNVSHISNGGKSSGGYECENIQVKDQERNMGDSSTVGFMGGGVNADGPMNTDAWRNQRNCTNKTTEIHPNQGGMGLYGSEYSMGVARQGNESAAKSQCHEYYIPNPTPSNPITRSVESMGQVKMPMQYDQQLNSDRMNPDLLSAFKSNPYAQSLNSY